MTIDNNKTVCGYKLSELPEQPVKELADYSRIAAAQGAVLLKNDGVLPFAKGEKISVFGRMQKLYYKSGTGSGGMVNVNYVTNIYDSLKNSGDVQLNEKLASIYDKFNIDCPYDEGEGWGKTPWSQVEMPLNDEIVADAAACSDAALIIIGRTAGEDIDNHANPGSFMLTELEYDMIKRVSAAFKRACLVINSGNIIDMSFLDTTDLSSVIYVFQGGQEGGNAAADLLCGKVTPSGKLTDTIAFSIEDYPSTENFGAIKENFYAEDIYVGYRYFETFAKDKVRFPFGFGMSYTTFELKTDSARVEDDKVCIDITVRNTGSYAGREVVQVYYNTPQGLLGKPLRALAAFAKTETLQPSQSQTLQLSFALSDMASYDDGGITGNKSCYLLEAGNYEIYVGTDVRSASLCLSYNLPELRITQHLSEALAPVKQFKRIKPELTGDTYTPSYEQVPTRTVDLMQRIINSRPADIAYTGDCGYKLLDVADNKCTLDEFIAQLSDFDLACIVRGEGMSSPKVTPGTGSAFGGVTDSLLGFGIPVACTTDGPSGVRLDSGAKATAIPIGTLLASTWDTELIEKLFVYEGIELYANKIDALLGPGMNIHRNPLNGRNFEYFSEDPYLTGVVAAAICRGIATAGPVATIKHFFANNQEISRSYADSVISERACREIYLKGFEIAVKQGNATSIMTTYNPTNGFWNMSNFDLCTTVLRDEWQFEGIAMSDWWAKANVEGSEGIDGNLKAMVRAQNDLFMVCRDSASYNDNTIKGLEEGFITRGELQRSARNILKFILKAPVFARYVNDGCKVSFSSEIDDSKAVEFIRFSNVAKAVDYSFECDKDRFFYFVFDMSSTALPLAQMTVTLYMDGKTCGLLMISGTEGKTITVKREIYCKAGTHKLRLDFGDTISVSQLTLKK